MRHPWRYITATLLVLLVAAVGWNLRPPNSTNPPATTPNVKPSAQATPPDAAGLALSQMTEAERVGQLLMAGTPSSGFSPVTANLIGQYHLGGIILNGNSTLTIDQTAALVAQLQQAAGPAKLLIATDQEGGLVQRLRGPGFTRIPSAVEQGAVAPDQLRQQTAAWAAQLRAAGVNLNLAPVLDTVPAGFGSNPPIGDLAREYGSSPDAVTSQGIAVAQGLADAGIAATAKHFPGLGRVTGNTDLTAGVTDTATTTDDPFLAPFQAAIAAQVPFVMISTAIYANLDPTQPAAFSPAVITDLLRSRLGFRRVIICDDLGDAAQVRAYEPGERAVRFIAAGGDVVLTVNASQIPDMAAALLRRANTDMIFRAQVDAAVLTILEAKHRLNLL